MRVRSRSRSGWKRGQKSRFTKDLPKASPPRRWTNHPRIRSRWRTRVACSPKVRANSWTVLRPLLISPSRGDLTCLIRAMINENLRTDTGRNYQPLAETCQVFPTSPAPLDKPSTNKITNIRTRVVYSPKVRENSWTVLRPQFISPSRRPDMSHPRRD